MIHVSTETDIKVAIRLVPDTAIPPRYRLDCRQDCKSKSDDGFGVQRERIFVHQGVQGRFIYLFIFSKLSRD